MDQGTPVDQLGRGVERYPAGDGWQTRVNAALRADLEALPACGLPSLPAQLGVYSGLHVAD